MSETSVVAEARLTYLRPSYVALGLAFLGGVGVWLVWGFVLAPEGDPLARLAWLLLCGLAMGSAIGSLTDLLVVGRLRGRSVKDRLREVSA